MVLGAATLAAAFVLRVGTEARVGLVMAGVAVVELGGLLAIRTRGPIRGLQRSAPVWAFVGAVLIAAGYIGITVGRNPRVEAAVGLISPLKLLAVLAAVVAGVFEEALFRGVLRDRLAAAGRSRVLQVFVSGLVSGCLHFYAFAGLPAALMAQAATTVLGWALAALYLVSGRSLWPCVVAHALLPVIMAARAISGKGLAGAGCAPLAGHCSQEDPSADDSSASWEECPHRQEQPKQ